MIRSIFEIPEFNPSDVDDLLDDPQWQEAARRTTEYVEWRRTVLEPIERYQSRFFTPWIPFVPVVLHCAPKHIKYRWKKRKKRIIKKWYHRYEREKYSYLRRLQIIYRYPNKKKLKKVMAESMCEGYHKSHDN